MMSGETLLLLIQTFSIYCGASGPGFAFEYDQTKLFVAGSEASKSCFTKLWTCSKTVKNADAIPFEAGLCISKHIKGELK